MPRTKAKYQQEPEQPQLVSFVAAGLPYSFDIKGASAYTDFSETDIRAAITGGQLAVVSDKPYRVLRSDLEVWAKSKRHFVQRTQKTQAA